MKKYWTAIVLVPAMAAMVTGFLFAAEPTKDTLATVKKNLADEKALLVDVREQAEWNAGHLSRAILLPLSEIRNDISAEALAKRISKDRIIYTHCAAGVRSCTAADILVKHGYDVRPLKPGYKDLVAAGFEKAEK